MDLAVTPAQRPIRGTFAVPPSKSMHQRALVLAALAAAPSRIVLPAGARPAGEDARRCAAAVAALGRWDDGHLGASRASLTLDLGESGTAFRFLVVLAALRPAGARTLVRGRPALLRRPHGELLRALAALGARLKRRRSGAVRVLGGGLRPGARLALDVSRSSQYASALLLAAPRIGGLTLELTAADTSRAYLDLTVRMLRDLGVPVEVEAERIHVPACAPHADAIRVEADASAAAAWWTAALLTGGAACVPGVGRASAQADTRLLGILEGFGATVGTTADGDADVRAPAGALEAPERVHDLASAPDLLFLVGVLGACSRGATVIRGVGHARGKESDRIAVLARGLRALGGAVDVDADDTIRIRGGALRGGRVDCAGDHRAAIAFGLLGLVVPGVVLAGAEAVAKSQPGFLDDLVAAAGDASVGEQPA